MNIEDSAVHSSLSTDKRDSGAGPAAAPVRGTVSVHIVTYNSIEDIEGCLDCVLAQSQPMEKIVVLDNASSDGTLERLRAYESNLARKRGLEALAHLPQLVIIESPVNTGFAGGQNRAMAAASSDYALVLNPDVRLHPNYVSELVERLQSRPEAGSAAGMLVRQPSNGVEASESGEGAIASCVANSRGEDAVSKDKGDVARAAESNSDHSAPGVKQPCSAADGLPQTVRAWLDRLPQEAVIDSTGLAMDAARQARDRGAGEPAAQWLIGGEVFGVSGAAAMYRRRMVEAVSIEGGFFDETFFAYKEDVDAAWRAQLLGWKALYVPEARALHARGWKEGGRAEISLFVRGHSYENRFYTLIKNERRLRNLPIIIAIELLKAGYILVKERDLISSWKTIWSQVPEMRRKRRELASKPVRR